MSGVDVLAVLKTAADDYREGAKELAGAYPGAKEGFEKSALQMEAALAAVAELIEACKERNEAEGQYGAAESMYGADSNKPKMREARGRMIRATNRYVAALSRIQPDGRGE